MACQNLPESEEDIGEEIAALPVRLPPWRKNLFGLVSLYEMLRFKAYDFVLHRSAQPRHGY
jgi:hypothetical protein